MSERTAARAARQRQVARGAHGPADSDRPSSSPRTLNCRHTTFTRACSSMRLWWMLREATAVSLPDNSQSTWSSRPTETGPYRRYVDLVVPLPSRPGGLGATSPDCADALAGARHGRARRGRGAGAVVTDDGNGVQPRQGTGAERSRPRSIEERIRLAGGLNLRSNTALAHGHHDHSLGREFCTSAGELAGDEFCDDVPPDDPIGQLEDRARKTREWT